ncbi:MAG: type IV secretion system protein [Rickettsiaceae bacterium]|nr:type IV secretion system protein [Rickettsiaceae bacterium]
MYNRLQPEQRSFIWSLVAISMLLIAMLTNAFRSISVVFHKFLLGIIITSIVSLVWSCNAKADSDLQKFLDETVNVIENLSCETQGVGNLLRTDEFAHTCIPIPVATYVIYDLFSFGQYRNFVLRLDLKGNNNTCNREERIDFKDKKLSFTMCSNIKLIEARSQLLGELVWDVIRVGWSQSTGGNKKFSSSYAISKDKYHNSYHNKKVGDSGVMFDRALGSSYATILSWKVIRDDDKLCVATLSVFGWVPVGCKYLKEPFPVSIYSEFIDRSTDGDIDVSNVSTLTTCGNMGSCYKKAYKNSRTGIVITGPIIGCVQEMIAKLMISKFVCSFDDIDDVLSGGLRRSSALYAFQKSMHKIVSALLTIYIILFGFKVLLTGDMPKKSELMNFLFKFLFVVYFSIGLNINSSDADSFERLDGMSQWAFPFLLNGMNELAGWLMNASPSGLCRFDDVKYEDGYEYLQLWDSLDCKISHYLGLDAIQTLAVQNASMDHDWSKLDGLSFPIPPYMMLLGLSLLMGNMMLVSLILMYPLLVISIGAFIVNAVVISMISIVILGVLAPLIVPMLLFEYTRGYFDSWVKLLISFLLQPMIAVAFMTFMLSIYDLGFYGTCKYKVQNLQSNGNDSVRHFIVDNDWSKYTNEEKDSCISSLGYILNPFTWFADNGNTNEDNTDEDNTDVTITDDDVTPWINDSSGDKNKERFNFLKAIKSSPGMFFDTFEMVFEEIKSLTSTLLTACFILYLVYHFSAQLSEFMADMTEGIKMPGMKANSIAKKGAEAMQQGSKDKASSGGAKSSDSASTGGGGSSSDSASTGGGGASSDSASTGNK